MTSDWVLSSTLQEPVEMTGIFVRVFELAATYLAQSTLILFMAWILLVILARRRESPLGSSPSTVEAVWKLAVILPLISTPFCVCIGWSPNVMSLHLCEAPSVSEQVASKAGIESSGRSLNGIHTQIEPTVSTESVDCLVTDWDVLGRSDLGETSPVSESPDAKQSATLLSGTAGAPIDVTVKQTQTEFETTSNLRSKESKAVQETPTAAVQRTTLAAVSWCGMAVLGWVLLCCGSLFVKALLLESSLRNCQSVTSNLRCEFNGLLANGDRIKLLYAAFLPTGHKARYGLQTAVVLQPFACGLLRWTIVLPEGIEERLSRSELRALLMHEVAHLVRHDPVWQWLGQILCTCLAFQPLNFLARRHWQQAAELLSDDWAVAHKVKATSLASCLTRIAESRLESNQNSSRVSLGLQVLGERTSLTNRIEWLLRTRHSIESKHGRFVAVIFFMTAFSVGLSSPRLELLPRAEAATAVDDAAELLKIELRHELSQTHDELARLQPQLNGLSNPEIDALAQELIDQISRIKSELKERSDQLK